MLMGESTFKVPGGKLIKIRVQVTKEKISNIVIMGDFFLYPEDTLDGLETSLVGVECEENTLMEKIDSYLASRDAVLIGATAKDLAKAILMALES
jgi:lipoate-protein ligase A